MKTIPVLLLALSLIVCASWYGGEVGAWIKAYIEPSVDHPVPTEVLRATDYSWLVPASGELLGFQTVPVLTPRVRRGSLKIGWLVEEGSVVEAGQVIVRFDETETQLELEQRQNEFSTYHYTIEKTEEDARGEVQILAMDREAADIELNYAEDQIRKDEDIFSRWEIQESLMSAALAGFKKESIEKKGKLQDFVSESDLNILAIEKVKVVDDIKLAEETLASMALVSPASGVLIYSRDGLRVLEVGTELWPGQSIGEVASLNKFRGIVQVPETEFSGVEPGKTVEITLEAFPAKTFTGKVDAVARIAKQISREDPRKYFECSLLLDVPVEMLGRLKPGMRLEAEIQTLNSKDALVVPKSAVVRDEGEFVVYVVDQGEYQRRRVEILGSDHGFYLLEGVREGEVLCLEDPHQDRKLSLPDFNAPRAPTRRQRFIYME